MKPEYLRTLVQSALAEDIGQGDVTTDHLIPSQACSKARMVAKAPGIICGLDLSAQVFKELDPKVNFRRNKKDGHAVKPGDVIAEISGLSRALLSGERVALNFLSMLSGIATQTRQFVDAVKPYKAKILDTRKTTPLLRQLERYAVKTGGGVNHRFDLHEMVMIKDNHWALGCWQDAHTVIQQLKKKTRVEVEVDNLTQFKKTLSSKADIILLDNMTPAQIREAVRLRRQHKSRVLLEASGGINLKNIKRYAAAGVDRISIGALTHSFKALDISLELETC